MFRRLLRVGVDAQTPFAEHVRLVGMNAAAVVGMLLLMAGSVVAMGSVWLAGSLLLFGLLLAVPVLLNHFRRKRMARHSLFAIVYLGLVGLAVAFGASYGFIYYFYAFLASVLILETSDTNRFLAAAGICFTVIVLSVCLEAFDPLLSIRANAGLFQTINIVFSCLYMAALSWITLLEVRAYHARLAKGRKFLQDSNEMKDRMLSIIGHDLKSPLGNLKNSLWLLESGALTADEQQELIKEVHHELGRSSELLDTLLVWASQSYLNSKTTGERRKQVFDLAGTAARVVRFYEQAAAEKQILLQSHVPEGMLVKGDADQILFVLRNLVGNAIKFSKTDGSAYISISADRTGRRVAVSVEDNGIGMKPEVADNLFRLDRRVTSEGTMQEKGHGLGLLYCKSFVEANGGDLQVSTEEGQGSRFSFRLRAGTAGPLLPRAKPENTSLERIQ